MSSEKPQEQAPQITDLPEQPDVQDAESVKGGFISVTKTPSPSGPIPIPYPVVTKP
jgi:hypothetical protein